MSDIKTFLQDMRNSEAGTAKVASETAPSVSAARDAVAAAASNLGATKTAAQNSPSAIDELTKIASDLADADEHAQMKQAHLHGAAIFDGFIARANQYGQNVPTHAPKVASQRDDGTSIKLASQLGYAEAGNVLSSLQARGSQAKTAAQQQQNIKLAAQQGYGDADSALGRFFDGSAEKTAQDQKLQGMYDAAEKVAAAAADCFRRGHDAAHALDQALSS